eukprot:scaffold7328_cov314-Pinguiococcus_pyrenoidosus.AAC.67
MSHAIAAPPVSHQSSESYLGLAVLIGEERCSAKRSSPRSLLAGDLPSSSLPPRNRSTGEKKELIRSRKSDDDPVSGCVSRSGVLRSSGDVPMLGGVGRYESWSSWWSKIASASPSYLKAPWASCASRVATSTRLPLYCLRVTSRHSAGATSAASLRTRWVSWHLRRERERRQSGQQGSTVPRNTTKAKAPRQEAPGAAAEATSYRAHKD